MTSQADFEELLSSCGVTERILGDAPRKELDERGYTVLGNVLDAGVVDRARAALERHAAANADDADLRLADDALEVAYMRPAVLASAWHVLKRPFRVFQLASRNPRAGYGQQGLHTDWMPRQPRDAFAVVTALWLLDEFASDNGATRVVPGSHLDPRPLPKSLQAPAGSHPEEITIRASAGSLLVFNGHLWHSGTRNVSGAPRRVLQCQFVACDAARPADRIDPLPERVTPAQRRLLGWT